MRSITLCRCSVFSVAIVFCTACSKTPSPLPPESATPALEKKQSSEPTTYDGGAVEAMITGDTGATPAQSLNALLDKGMSQYSLGQQRALSQLLGTEEGSEQDAATENADQIPSSLQQMSDRLLEMYKQQIGVDPEARVSEPKI